MGTLGCLGSYRGMGGRRCVEVVPGVREKQESNIILSLSHIVNSLFIVSYSRNDVPWKTSLPSSEVRLSRRVVCTCEAV